MHHDNKLAMSTSRHFLLKTVQSYVAQRSFGLTFDTCVQPKESDVAKINGAVGDVPFSK